MSKTTISKELIINKSQNDQNILIAGELIQLGAGDVVAVEIELYAFNLKINGGSVFIIQDMKVTFVSLNDGSYIAQIEINEDTETNDNPTDMIALLNNVIPVNKAPEDPPDSDLGYWAAGSAAAMIMPAMGIHHLYKSRKERLTKEAKKAEEDAKVAEAKAKEAEDENLDKESYEQFKKSLVDNKAKLKDEEKKALENKDELENVELKVENNKDLEKNDELENDNIQDLKNSDYNQEIEDKSKELDTETNTFNKAVNDGATKEEIFNQEKNDTLFGANPNTYTPSFTKITGGVGESSNKATSTSSDITDKIVEDSTNAAVKSGVATDADGNIIEDTATDAMEGLAADIEGNVLLETLAANPELLG